MQELGNIIGGIAKIKAAKNPREFLKLTNGGRPVDPRKEIEMHFQMGLPESQEDGKESLNLGEEPKFTVPFTVEGENAFLQVYFQHT